MKLRPVKLVQNRRRVIRIPKSDILLRRTASSMQFAKVAIEELGMAACSCLNCEVAKGEPCETSAICCAVPGMLRSEGFSNIRVVRRGERWAAIKILIVRSSKRLALISSRIYGLDNLSCGSPSGKSASLNCGGPGSPPSPDVSKQRPTVVVEQGKAHTIASKAPESALCSKPV